MLGKSKEEYRGSNIDITLANTSLDRLMNYARTLQDGTCAAGVKLANYCAVYLDKLPSALNETELLQALLRTKEAVIFAESQAKLDGSDWTPTEYEILCSAGILYDVRTFDNGVWGERGEWSAFKDYSDEPFEQLVIIVSAPLLTKSSPDYARIVKDGNIDYAEYYAVMEERLLPLLIRANQRAEKEGKKLVLALPGLGCGAYSGEFQGMVGEYLNASLKDMFNRHNARLGNIDTIIFDGFDECKWEEHTFGELKYRVRSSRVAHEGIEGKALPQLSAASEYAEDGDDFANNKKAKVVAGDGCSIPDNDANTLSRNTDEGAFGSATNSATVLSGVDGNYHAGNSAKNPPLYKCPNNNGKWGETFIDKKTELLPVITSDDEEKTLHIIDIESKNIELHDPKIDAARFRKLRDYYKYNPDVKFNGKRAGHKQPADIVEDLKTFDFSIFTNAIVTSETDKLKIKFGFTEDDTEKLGDVLAGISPKDAEEVLSWFNILYAAAASTPNRNNRLETDDSIILLRLWLHILNYNNEVNAIYLLPIFVENCRNRLEYGRLNEYEVKRAFKGLFADQNLTDSKLSELARNTVKALGYSHQYWYSNNNYRLIPNIVTSLTNFCETILGNSNLLKKEAFSATNLIMHLIGKLKDAHAKKPRCIFIHNHNYIMYESDMVRYNYGELSPTTSIDQYRINLKTYEYQKHTKSMVAKICAKHPAETYFDFLQSLGVEDIVVGKGNTNSYVISNLDKRSEFIVLLKYLHNTDVVVEDNSVVVTADMQKALIQAYAENISSFKNDRNQLQLCKDALVKLKAYTGDVEEAYGRGERFPTRGGGRFDDDAYEFNLKDKLKDLSQVLLSKKGASEVKDYLEGSVPGIALSLGLYLTTNYQVLSNEERACIARAQELLIKEDEFANPVDCLYTQVHRSHYEASWEESFIRARIEKLLLGGPSSQVKRDVDMEKELLWDPKGDNGSFIQPRFLHTLEDEVAAESTTDYILLPVLNEEGKVVATRLIYKVAIGENDDLYPLCKYRYYQSINGKTEEITFERDFTDALSYQGAMCVKLQHILISEPPKSDINAENSLMLSIIAYMECLLPGKGSKIGHDILQKCKSSKKKSCKESLEAVIAEIDTIRQKELATQIEEKNKEEASSKREFTVEEIKQQEVENKRLLVKQFEKSSYPYIYVDDKNQVHVIVPITSGEEIAMDNTCQAARETKQFWGIGLGIEPKLTVFSVISRYIDDLENDIAAVAGDCKAKQERLASLKQNQALLNTILKTNNALSSTLGGGLPAYPKEINAALAQAGENAIGMRLSPKWEDSWLRINNPLCSFKRQGDKAYEKGFAASLLATFNRASVGSKAGAPKLYPLEKAKLYAADEYKKRYGEETLKSDEDLTNLKTIISELLRKREIPEIAFDVPYYEKRDTVFKPATFEYVTSVVDNKVEASPEDAIDCILTEANWEIATANEEASPFPDVKDARGRSIAVQFFIGVANLYYYGKTGKTINFGEVIESDPEIQNEFVEICHDYYGEDLGIKILELINKHIKCDFDKSDTIEISRKFRARYLQVKASPHFDEFLQLIATKDGNFYGYLNRIGLHLSQFCKHFSKDLYNQYFVVDGLPIEIRHESSEVSNVMLYSSTGTHNVACDLEFERNTFLSQPPEKVATILALSSAENGAKDRVLDHIPESLQNDLKSNKEDWEKIKGLLLSKLDFLDSTRFLKNWGEAPYFHFTPEMETKLHMKYSEESSKKKCKFSIDDLTGKSRKDKLIYILMKLIPGFKVNPRDASTHEAGGFIMPCSITNQALITDLTESEIDKVYVSTAVAESIYSVAREKILEETGEDIYVEYNNSGAVADDSSRIVVAMRKLFGEVGVQPDKPPFNIARHPWLLTSFAGEKGFYISSKDKDKLQGVLTRIQILHYEQCSTVLTREEVEAVMAAACERNAKEDVPLPEELFTGSPSTEKLEAAMEALGLGILGAAQPTEGGYKLSLEYQSLKILYPILAKALLQQVTDRSASLNTLVTKLKTDYTGLPTAQNLVDISDSVPEIQNYCTNLEDAQKVCNLSGVHHESRVIYTNYYKEFKDAIKAYNDEADKIEDTIDEVERTQFIPPKVAESIYLAAQKTIADLHSKYNNKGDFISKDSKIIVAMREVFKDFNIQCFGSEDADAVQIMFLAPGFKIICANKEQSKQLAQRISELHCETCRTILSEQEVATLMAAASVPGDPSKENLAATITKLGLEILGDIEAIEGGYALSLEHDALRVIYPILAKSLIDSSALGVSDIEDVVSREGRDVKSKRQKITDNFNSTKGRIVRTLNNPENLFASSRATYARGYEEVKTTIAGIEQEVQSLQSELNELRRLNPEAEAYSYQESEDLYFTMVKVTDLNREFWQSYAENNYQSAQTIDIMRSQMKKFGKEASDHPRYKMAEDIPKGLAGFHVLKNPSDDVEQWVVMASTKPIDNPNKVNLRDVEMTMMVSTAKDFPFIVNMGILRTFYSLFSEHWHKNISKIMHALPAKVMRMRYPDKELMVNSALPIMNELLVKAFREKGIEDAIQPVNKDCTYKPNGQLDNVTLTIPAVNEEDADFVMQKNNSKTSWFFEQLNLWGMKPTTAVSLRQLSTLHEIDGSKIVNKKFERADRASKIADVNGSLPKDFIDEFTNNTPKWITDIFLPEFKKAQEARKRIICTVTGAVIGGATGYALRYGLCSRTSFPRDIISAAALCASLTIVGIVLGYFTADIFKERSDGGMTH